MKKIKSMSLLLLSGALISLVGCNEVPTIKEVPSYVNTFLKEASKSYTYTSLEKLLVNKKDGSLLFKEELESKVKMMTGENTRIEKTGTYEENEATFPYKLSFVKDANGFLATESLNYENKVVTNAVREDGNKLVFDREFINPFVYLDSSDFKEETDGVFSLNQDKTLQIAYQLTNYNLEVEDILFNFKDESIDTIELKFKPFDGRALDKNLGEYIEANYVYTITFVLENVGSTVIKGVEPVKSVNKEKEDILKNALDNLGTNYTIVMNEHDRGVPPNVDYDDFWYFDGSSKVYHQRSYDDHSKKYDLYYKADKDTYGDDKLRLYGFDIEKNEWIYKDAEFSQSYNANPRDYSYFTPKNGGVAPELFEFNEETNVYTCKVDDVLGYIGNNFLPGCYQIGYFTKGQGDKCEVKLDQNNKVEEITVGYTRILDGFELSTDFTLTYRNIGTTVIPSWVEE